MTNLLGMEHSAPRIAAPAGSCDCHTHVFGPAARFPFATDRAYTPSDASIADLRRLHTHLGIDRVVIVHPSPYGIDNRVSVDAIARIGRDRARGVAVVDPDIAMADLQALDAAGMRGARVNLATAGIDRPARALDLIEATARRVAPLGWHVQVFTDAAVLAALGDRLVRLPVPLVVDHFGRIDAARGLDQPGLTALRALVSSGRAYVKLSAAYRVSRHPDLADVAPIAQALIADNPERVVWGTDWPHPGGGPRGDLSAIEPFIPVDDGAALNRLAGWAGGTATLRRILVDNPARLYGFA